MASLHEIILAGLLHDVGKLSQRAFRSGDGISPATRRMEGMVCPESKNGGYATHLHALYTLEFCDRYLENLPSSISADVVARLASSHHRASSDDEDVIAKADRLSAAADRVDDGEETRDGRSAFRRTRLQAIAASVNIGAGQMLDKWVHALEPLSPENARPTRSGDSRLAPSDGEDLTASYATLWDKFLIQWNENRCADPWGFICRAQSILEHFTWCVPSATNVLPDISLADHLKTTAAIAGCLHLAGGDAGAPFLLVAGDFGGIQPYIFDIRSGAGGLARRLRSRSFFVSILSDTVVHRVLRRLGLPLTNCIMAAGGRFYMLLPNRQSALDAVDAVRRETDQWTMKETNGEVHVHLAASPVARDELQDFAKALAKVRAALYAEKRRPASSVLQRDGAWAEKAALLDPVAIPDGGGLCDSCGKRGGHLQEVRERHVPVCPSCNDDRMTGRLLPRSQFVCFYQDATGRRRVPGGSFSLMTQEDSALHGDPYVVLDLDGKCGGPEDWPLVAQWRARYIPHGESGDALTFEDMAEEASGREALAYLKADVDNLGLIFAQGLGGTDSADIDKRSISRMATLSRSLEVFLFVSKEKVDSPLSEGVKCPMEYQSAAVGILCKLSPSVLMLE